MPMSSPSIVACHHNEMNKCTLDRVCGPRLKMLLLIQSQLWYQSGRSGPSLPRSLVLGDLVEDGQSVNQATLVNPYTLDIALFPLS